MSKLDITGVLLLLVYALLMGFIAYRLGKDEGWREGYTDGWCAHKKVSAAIEEFSRAVFDAGTTWSGDDD